MITSNLAFLISFLVVGLYSMRTPYQQMVHTKSEKECWPATRYTKKYDYGASNIGSIESRISETRTS